VSAAREPSAAAAGGPQPPADRGTVEVVRVLFVCLGNICRSPTAEGVMRKLVREAGLEQRVEVQSAGTGSWHVGEPPDRRALRAAAGRGIALEGRARQVEPSDFEEFHLIVAMDRSNLRALEGIAPGPERRARLRLMREFGGTGGEPDVPDPYHGGAKGFERVLDIVEECCAGLLAEIREAVDGPRERRAGARAGRPAATPR
jgi:protein-tyrosine phosphatase